jgi:copper chaperone
MLEFNLPDMSCGHCVKSVTQAVQQVDPQARVTVDLGQKKASVDSAQDRQPFVAALTEAGYPPAA